MVHMQYHAGVGEINSSTYPPSAINPNSEGGIRLVFHTRHGIPVLVLEMEPPAWPAAENHPHRRQGPRHVHAYSTRLDPDDRSVD